MGCDIHLVVEQKVNGKWLGVFATDKSKHRTDLLGEERNYDFFANLAGVRDSHGNSKVKPLGIPADASELAKLVIEEQCGDDHSHSYLSAEKFCDIFNEVKGSDEEQPYDILGINEYSDNYDLDNHRVIFYFDN